MSVNLGRMFHTILPSQTTSRGQDNRQGRNLVRNLTGTFKKICILQSTLHSFPTGSSLQARLTERLLRGAEQG